MTVEDYRQLRRANPHWYRARLALWLEELRVKLAQAGI